ncbi:MAG: hypothetical protein PUC37_02035 [Spirochaetales bacterium]|nr:hypothetical protein [Spirochaetales bacterium]
MTTLEINKFIINVFEDYLAANKDDSDIISILSDIDCDVWNDRAPNDPATFNDLIKEIKKYADSNDMFTDKQVILGLKKFLSVYKEKYDYKVDNFQKYLIDMFK